MDLPEEKDLGTDAFDDEGLFFSNEIPLEVPDDPEGPSYCTVNELGKQLLHAAGEGDVAEIRNLMSRGAPFTADWLGTSPLHLAAQNNRLEVCNILIRAGMTKDARTKVDRTPLHLAAYEGHVAIVECLINMGADCDAKDLLNMTALHWAAQKGHAEVAACLIRHGAATNLVNNFNLTPTDIAMQMRRMDIVDLINMAVRDPAEATKNLTLELLADSNENSCLEPLITIPDDDNELLKEVNHNDIDTSEMDTTNVDTNMDTNMDTNIDTSNIDVPSIDASVPMVETILVEDESFGSFPPIDQSMAEQLVVESTDPSRNSAVKFLEGHGISLLPVDEGSILNTVMEAGHSVVLTEAGKQALNSIKPGDINIEYVKPKPVSPVKPKKIITMTSDQFMLMTQNGGFNNSTNILKQLNGKMLNSSKLPGNRIVMKKNKVMRISQSNLHKELQIHKGSKLQKIDTTSDVNSLLEQLKKAYSLVENYKSRLAKAESENASYKQQVKTLMEQLELSQLVTDT